MSARNTTADVAVVGSGATGGWAAKVLAEAGLRVVVIEAGRKLDVGRDQRGRDYWQYKENEPVRGFANRRLASRQHIQRQHPLYTPRNHHFFVDDVSNPYETADGRPFTWIRGRHEGGRSMIWGGQTWRLSDYELKPGDAPDPALVWPLGYADLAPYYDRVERFLGVAGHRDHLAEIPDGVVAEPRPSTPAEQAFHGFVRDKCRRPIVVTRSVRPDVPAESYAGTDSWPRFSSLGSTLAAATATGRARVVTDAIARRVLVDRDAGRATGVECVDASSHETFVVSAGAVVVCASTIESARLLLNSHPQSNPAGLGNSSGVLGRYLSDHCHAAINGFIPEDHAGHPDEAPQAWNGDGLYIPRFRNRGVRDMDYYGGFGTMLLMGRRGLPITDPAMAARPSHHGMLAVIFGEVVPRVDNRVTLSATLRDDWNIPAAHIDYGYSDNEGMLIADAVASIGDMLQSFGCDIVSASQEQSPGLMVHEVGTARMGVSPATSYLDCWCRSWDVPNLYVTDGAAWPSSAYQNPTLTMMALTVRACEHLAGQLARNEI